MKKILNEDGQEPNGLSARQVADLGNLKVTWVTRSFLDYRIPVFAALDEAFQHKLHVVYSTIWTPSRVQQKLESVLGERAIGLSGERRIGADARADFANSRICIPYQPGLFRTVKRTLPDIVIGDGFFRWTPAALASRMVSRTPMVLCYERTFHTERKSQWFRTAYRRKVVRWTDAMCCNGRQCVEYTQWLGMPRSRITTGHMAADTDNLRRLVDRIPMGERQDLRKKEFVVGNCFLYVGRLIRLKGIAELLSAWCQLEKKNPNSATLLLVGDGEEKDALSKYARENNLKNVRFLGAIDYDSIAKYYAIADVLVMPTLEDNWSLVVPEAMACGLPILCSKYNGCWPELVHEGENGWVFDPLSATDTARVLSLAVEQTAKLSQMGEVSREIVSHHTPANAAEAILKACQIALNARSPKRNGRKS